MLWLKHVSYKHSICCTYKHTHTKHQSTRSISFFYYDIFWVLYCLHVTEKEKKNQSNLNMSFDSSWPVSSKSVCWSDLKEKPNYCSGEAGGTWSTFALGQLCLGRAPLRLQRSTVSWGVFRQMWRAACDQCHFNFSLVIVWWRTRQTDASLAGGAWMQDSCFVAALLSSFFLKQLLDVWFLTCV